VRFVCLNYFDVINNFIVVRLCFASVFVCLSPGFAQKNVTDLLMKLATFPDVNAEGDDDGKNHRYAENHVFR